ncbi:hypothetical protein [Spirosoma koreense]
MNDNATPPTNPLNSNRPQLLLTYLNQSPGYNLAALRGNAGDLATVFMAHAEQVEFSLKRYLYGDRTQQQLFSQIQDFVNLDRQAATDSIGHSIFYVFRSLFALEAYELLSIYELLCEAIADQFHITLIDPDDNV